MDELLPPAVSGSRGPAGPRFAMLTVRGHHHEGEHHDDACAGWGCREAAGNRGRGYCERDDVSPRRDAPQLGAHALIGRE
jgi:hypothetical protein